jgi:histidine triad (HIT) family protein
MSYDPTNIFARILRGEIPSAKILETDKALAFVDVNPVNRGHVLLIPKAEAATLSDLSDEDAAHLGSLLPRLCRAVRSVTGCDALNVIVNHGEVAGQTIFHVHFHIIPRFKGDAVHWPWPHQSYVEGEMAKLRVHLAEALKH